MFLTTGFLVASFFCQCLSLSLPSGLSSFSVQWRPYHLQITSILLSSGFHSPCQFASPLPALWLRYILPIIVACNFYAVDSLLTAQWHPFPLPCAFRTHNTVVSLPSARRLPFLLPSCFPSPCSVTSIVLSSVFPTH